MNKPLGQVMKKIAWLMCAVVFSSFSLAAGDDASAATAALFNTVSSTFDWNNDKDFENASRGLIARYPDATIKDATGRVIWTFPDFEAMRSQRTPHTVHPILWRQQQLNSANGLFKIADTVYQLRGFDLANMTIIEGETGVIIVDPITSVEASSAALKLYFMHRPRRPVVAVIYTHSHMDHYGGVKGVVAVEDVKAGKVAILAPEGFLEEAVSENVSAGNAMLRRTVYYSGIVLPKGPTGSVGAGLGPGVSSGRLSFIPPTEEIAAAGENRVIDGVEFQFIGANDTEAPAELMFYLPQHKILDIAEVAVRTVHNVLTPRGALVRNSANWWKTIDHVIKTFSDAEIMIGQHHWPTWGSADIHRYLSDQRDFYKLVHDRALHLTNSGKTMGEIGRDLQRTDRLTRSFTLQDHYGTLSGAGKAVYQRYIGWYDGNPANLDPLPDEDSAKRYVEYMGGAQQILERARRDFEKGEYRWVAEVLNRLLFAEPDNLDARELQAQTLTQLGYQQVSATWRNVYLAAAMELRSGVARFPGGSGIPEFIEAMPPEMLLDFAGIALSPSLAKGKSLSVNIEFGDDNDLYNVSINDGLLNYRTGKSGNAVADIVLDNLSFNRLLTGQLRFQDAIENKRVKISGDVELADEFFSCFVAFRPDFNIVTP